MDISFWQTGWRMLWRDARAGDLHVLLLAVTLAVAALTAVGFFADRLKSGLQRDARQLLGGDAVVVSDQPTPPPFLEQARTLGLTAVSTLAFPTMVRASDAQGGASKLVALKAVAPGYPLRGSLRTTPETAAGALPQPGQAWVDASLLEALGLEVGDTLLVGAQSLQIAAILTFEPDRGAGFMNFAPRVLMQTQDVAATGLIQPASRVTYRFSVAGDEPSVRRFIAWAEVQIKALRGVRIESLQTGRPEMGQTLERAEKFLNLVALLAALLSAVALALAARAFAAAHLDDCAILRVLGVSQRGIAASYTVEFALAGLGASALGVLLGYGVHHLFLLLLAGLVDTALPAPSLWPVLFGLGLGLTLLLAFGLPPVLQLAKVPALRVIRRDLGTVRLASLGTLLLGVAGFAALLLAASRDWKLGLIAVTGFGAAVLVFAGLGWVGVWLLRRWLDRQQRAPQALVLAARQMAARPAFTVVQISALALGLLALVLLVLLRTDLIGSWRQATPPDAPNRFVINIMPEQANAFRQTLAQAGVTRYDWYPMIRGRLVAINGRLVKPDDYAEDRAQRLLDREFNLSFNATLPPHNVVVAGRWQDGEADALSVEAGIAATLQLKFGDSLRFDVGGMPIDAKITSLRKVDWGSLRANFFVMYPLAQMQSLPLTYMAAYKAPAIKGFDNTLVRQFPNVTNVDMSSTIAQVQRVLEQVIGAVEFLFGFVLVAGLVVLFAAVSATRDARAREFAIMRALGAGSALLRQVQRVELLTVGTLAGFLAALVAAALGWALARYVFEFAWQVSVWVLLLGALAGAVLALAAGWWGLRDVLHRPVVETLRRATPV